MNTPPWTTEACTLQNAVDWAKAEVARAALARNNGNRQKTADELDVNRTTLYKLLKRSKRDPQRD